MPYHQRHLHHPTLSSHNTEIYSIRHTRGVPFEAVIAGIEIAGENSGAVFSEEVHDFYINELVARV
jgi:hypothetical protein